jgi:hypothetical protein
MSDGWYEICALLLRLISLGFNVPKLPKQRQKTYRRIREYLTGEEGEIPERDFPSRANYQKI